MVVVSDTSRGSAIQLTASLFPAGRSNNRVSLSVVRGHRQGHTPALLTLRVFVIRRVPLRSPTLRRSLLAGWPGKGSSRE
jgi:hypothetical protein